MRILITGSRNWTEEWLIRSALVALRDHVGPEATITIVHGGAQGADSFAQRHAKGLGYATEIWRPDYKTYPGPVAPLKRNDAMLDSGIDLVLAFMLGTPEKGGTLYTVNGAKARGIPVVIYNWPGDAAYTGD